MVLIDILSNTIRKAMKQAGIDPVSSFVLGWSGKEKVLMMAEKKKEHYIIHGLRVFGSEDVIRKVSSTDRARSEVELANVFATVAKKVSMQSKEGFPITDPNTTFNLLLTMDEEVTERAAIANPVQEVMQIPTSGSIIGYICDQNLQVTNNPVLLSEKMLLHHVIITGSTGGGKTEVAKRIVTEVEKNRKKILVITPEAHLWGKLENVHSLGDDDSDLEDGINVVDCTNAKDFAKEASHVIESVIEHYGKMEQTDNLRLLVVIDEAHLFIDQKDFESVLESATRILRKFGVSCVLLSHTYADFSRGIRSNVQTHIALYTNWARDLSFIKAFQADGTVDYSKLLLSMPEGYGIFRSREFLRNQPFPCKFLKCYEVLQPTLLKHDSTLPFDDADQRRLSILQIVRESHDVSLDDIQLELKRKKIEVDDRTVYRDLAWLENERLVTVTNVEERGKKRYGPARN